MTSCACVFCALMLLFQTIPWRQIEACKICQRLVCASWCGGSLGQLVQFWGYFFNRELSETRFCFSLRRYSPHEALLPAYIRTYVRTCFRHFPVEKITPKLHKLSQRTATPGSTHQPLTSFACFDLAPLGAPPLAQLIRAEGAKIERKRILGGLCRPNQLTNSMARSLNRTICI